MTAKLTSAITRLYDHPCPLCGKFFSQKSELEAHLNRKYPCHPLDSDLQHTLNEFMNQNQIRKKTYPCPRCPKVFNRKDTLITHTRICPQGQAEIKEIKVVITGVTSQLTLPPNYHKLKPDHLGHIGRGLDHHDNLFNRLSDLIGYNRATSEFKTYAIQEQDAVMFEKIYQFSEYKKTQTLPLIHFNNPQKTQIRYLNPQQQWITEPTSDLIHILATNLAHAYEKVLTLVTNMAHKNNGQYPWNLQPSDLQTWRQHISNLQLTAYQSTLIPQLTIPTLEEFQHIAQIIWNKRHSKIDRT